jgi:hypothetical protein
MAYDLIPLSNTTNTNTSTSTSTSIFESKQKNLAPATTTQINEINKNLKIPILVILFLNSIFVYYLLTSKTYGEMYDSDTKKFYIITSLIFSYLQVTITLYTLYIYRKYILHIIKNDINRAFFIMFIVLFIIYMYSLVHLTDILVNIDEYNCKDISFFTQFFALMHIINILINISYIYKLLNK